jgi:DNA-binding response OmpR family regulator
VTTDSAVRGLILVIEDEPAIAEVIRMNLVNAGYGAHVEGDGEAGLAAARSLRPAAVILDVGLPGIDGIEVCRRMRAAQDWTPVLFVTARDDEVDRIVGLELGADDYVTKPFSPRELVARVRAVLRRSERTPELGDRIEVGELVLDVPRLRATLGDRVVELTPTEFSILATMAREPGRVFTRSQLLDAVHGVAFEAYERAIDAHVKNIRRKLEPEPGRPQYLLTVYGVGYRVAE